MFKQFTYLLTLVYIILLTFFAGVASAPFFSYLMANPIWFGLFIPFAALLTCMYLIVCICHFRNKQRIVQIDETYHLVV